jgi:hypothetical protein
VSGGKFASLTSGLLVRKGEARPSPVAPPDAFFEHVHDRLELEWPRSRAELAPAPNKSDARQRSARQAPAPEPQHSGSRPEPRASVQPAREIALHADHPDKPRRLMVSLSPDEYEMLGIVGVKRGVTRHQLLRTAFDEYLLQLVEEYGEGCNCIATGCSCEPAISALADEAGATR